MNLEQARGFIGQAVQNERLSPAYLITGSDKQTRRELAWFLAQALFCPEKGGAPEPCGKCESCRKIAADNHPDFFMIRGEGSMGLLPIDRVRQLKTEIYLSPYQAPYRVYLLEIEALREEAANAFLKTLEEPPETAVLILSSRTEREFLPTILSRVARIRLSESEAAGSDLPVVREALNLSWQNPSGIFLLARQAADNEEAELKAILEALVGCLRTALEFKHGLNAGFEISPEIQRLAARPPDEIRLLLEQVLNKRQDILRGRVSPRLGLESIFILLSKPVAAGGRPPAKRY